MEEVELYLLVPDLAKCHIYFKDFDPRVWFPNAQIVDVNTQVEFDTFFIIQGDKMHLNISAKKRIVGSFESYWYGNVVDSFEAPNLHVVHAMQPHRDEPPHNKWPKRYRSTLLPYSPYYEPGSNNFRNKGILLAIKDPCSPEFCKETIKARLDHFRAAIDYLNDGVKVSVAMGHRLEVDQNPAYAEELGSLLEQLKIDGATFLGKVSPTEMEDIVRQHSIIYTGKVGESMLYACFLDGLCLGSFPIIYSDWPEQFFRDKNIFKPYTDIAELKQRTDSLLHDGVLYSEQLLKLRLGTDLYIEWEGMEILKGLL